MVTIDKAYCEDYKKVMSFDEISSHEDFENIRGSLFCATPDCPSKLTYVRGEKACLRTFKGDNHSENCKDVFEREKKLKRAEKLETVLVTLNGRDFMKKHRYLLEKYLKEDVPKKPRKQKKKKISETANPTGEIIPYSQGKLGDGGQTLDEAKSEKINFRGPSFPAKELNQIIDDDIGSKCGIATEVLNVRKIRDKFYEIDVIQNKYKATLVLPESFFATQDMEAENNIEELARFKKNITAYKLYILTYCEVLKVSDKNLRLSVLNYDWLSVAVSKPPLKVLTLSLFVALYTRNHFSE